MKCLRDAASSIHRLSDVRGLILTVWLLVQPWWVWPHLFADVSHRLTLVVCCVALGLVTISRTAVRQALPGTWIALLVTVVAVMVTHQAVILRDGVYFRFFQETAIFSDGLIFVIALAWGAWALRQLPVAWFRRLPWVGVAFVLANLGTLLWSRTGLLGLDRLLGATGVLWFPLLLVWQPAWAVLPLLLVVASGKVTEWIGLTVAIGMLRPRWLLGSVSAGAYSCWWFRHDTSVFPVMLWQRLRTWKHVGMSTVAHPVVGWGFSPMAEQVIQNRYGYVLPTLHSDWMALAFHAGWIVTGLALWSLWRLLRPHPVTRWAKGLRAALAAVVVMAAGQAVVSHARIGGLVMLWLVWLVIEQAAHPGSRDDANPPVEITGGVNVTRGELALTKEIVP